MRLIADMIAYTVEHVPKWNPINICSYHLQEAGATPVQEIAYAMSNAIAVLDAARERVERAPGEHSAERWNRSSGASPSSSTPACASSRSTRSCARCRSCGRSSGASATACSDERHLRFRYGVQVNSLGLTEAQPENNVQRIVLEALAVTLGRDARARAIQLPAWNEALGLPRPWDQQWSLRIQQVLAYETDILEYPDIFEGSKVMDALVAELLEGARAEMAVVAEHGGAVEAVPYMKAALVDSHRERLRRIEAGEQVVVGQNRFTETEVSPLTADAEGGILVVDPALEAEQIEALRRWRSERDQAAVDDGARARSRRSPATTSIGENLMVADDRRRARRRHDRRVGGHAARGVRQLPRPHRRRRGRRDARPTASSSELRDEVSRLQEQLGRRPKILVGKPGLDGHSNGAEQIAVRARDAGMDVVYEGIRLTPGADRRLGAAGGRARDRPVDPVGLAPRADPGGDRRAARRRRERAGGRRRDHPRAGRGGAARGGRRRRVHAEGLRHHPHHARHRGARGGTVPSERRVAASGVSANGSA